MRYEITQTVEWREILLTMDDYLVRYKEDVVNAARKEKSVSQMIGRYDGFRQAVEKLRVIGKEDD